MKPREFIREVTRMYHDARMPLYPDKNIKRGRSHSISSIAEDLFAHYLVSNGKNIEAIYVDQPMTISSAGSKISIYPDITIVKNGAISAFLDLKMDLGWKRHGLVDLCKKHRDLVVKVRGAGCSFRDGQTKTSRTVKVSEHASYSVVIISGTNINPELLKTQLEQVEALRPDVEVFVLCKKGHLNSYGVAPEELEEKLGIDDTEFYRLTKRLSLL